jgi:hypothetical protein
MDEEIIFNPGAATQATGNAPRPNAGPSAFAEPDEIVFNPGAPAPQQTELEKYRAGIAALSPEKRAALIKEQQGRAAKFEQEYNPKLGSFGTFISNAADMATLGTQPYLAAAMAYPFGNKSYGDLVTDMKGVQRRSNVENPNASMYGTGAGFIASLPKSVIGSLPNSLSGIGSKVGQSVLSSMGQGAAFGLTQGGTGLEDLLSGKSYGLPALQQAGMGAIVGGVAHKVGDAISPAAVKDAAKYAYNLGVKLPAGIMNAGKKGYEYLSDGATQTANGVRKAFDDLSGDFNPASTAKDAIDDFMAYTPYVPPQLAPTINYFSKTLSEAPETAMDAVLNAGPKALRAMRATLKANGADQTWEGLQNGFMQHIAGPKGQFRFGDFSKRLGNIPTESRKILMDGWDQGQKMLGDVGNLADSTMHRGVNLIDAASDGLTFAGKETGKVSQWARNLATGSIGTGFGVGLANSGLSAAALAKLGLVAPVVAAGYGAKKAVDVSGKALSKRNIAQSPTVSKIVDNAVNSAKRYVTSTAGDADTAVARYTQKPLKSLVNTFLEPEQAKWYSKNMPAFLGGHADGGRIAYKKGGAVNSNIEPLVQKLMIRYKAVKRSQDSGTKTLLQQPDQAIVKALDVAQKAI